MSGGAPEWSSGPAVEVEPDAGQAGWGDDFDAAPRRRTGLPTWVWTCGCGCLVAVAAVVLAVVLSFDRLAEYAKTFADPDEQWARIAEVLPYDERPAGVEPMGLPFLGSLAGIDTWFLRDRQRGYVAALLASRDDRGVELLDGMLEESGAGDPFQTERHSPEGTAVVVQGRELRAVRFELRVEGEAETGGSATWNMDARGAAILVDVSPADRSRRVLVQLARDWELEPITDDEVRAFLAPFRIGEDR